MAMELRCRDVGVDCDEVIRGETQEEVMANAAEHARTQHNMKEISPEMGEKIKEAIRMV